MRIFGNQPLPGELEKRLPSQHIPQELSKIAQENNKSRFWVTPTAANLTHPNPLTRQLAWRAFYDQFAPNLARWLSRRVDPNDIEDVTQAAFAKVSVQSQTRPDILENAGRSLQVAARDCALDLTRSRNALKRGRNITSSLEQADGIADQSSENTLLGSDTEELVAQFVEWAAGLKSGRHRAVATAMIKDPDSTDRDLAEIVAPILGKKLSVDSVTSARKQVIEKFARSPLHRIFREHLAG